MEFEDLYNRLPEELRNALANCEQNPIYHPEGFCDVHIRLVFEYAKVHYPEDVDLQVCAIFHDIGKPETQSIKYIDGRKKISNIGHELHAERYIDKYFDLFSDITTNKEKIKEICTNHMKAHLYLDKSLKKPAKREAFEKLKYFDDIIKFAKCDNAGKQI